MVEGAYRKRRAASFRTEESAPKGKETRRTGIRRRRLAKASQRRRWSSGIAKKRKSTRNIAKEEVRE